MSRRSRPRLDWSFGPGHGPVSGVVNAAAGMYGGTMWLAVGDAHPLWGATAGALMGAAGAGVAAAYGQPSRSTLFRLVSWAAAGAWSTWSLCGLQWLASPGTPWSTGAFYPLAVGAAVTGTVGWRMQVAEERAEAEAVRQAAAAAQAELDHLAQLAAEKAARQPVNEQEEIAFAWEPLLCEKFAMPTEIKGVQIWDPPNGYTLDVNLPPGKVLGDVKHFEETLASAAPRFDTDDPEEIGLPDGCGVEIIDNPGMARRSILIRVTTVPALAADIPAPPAQMNSIDNPIAQGVKRDGTEAVANLRYNCMALIGQVDSGKSNQLNVNIKGLSECTDVILAGIDITGNGRVFRPWLRAYHEGRAPRPVIANVAPTELHARALVQSLIQIIDGRTADYADLMHEEGTDKIMPRPTLPQIVLIVDEFGKLPMDLQMEIVKVSDTGRGAAVRVIGCGLAAGSPYLPTPFIEQCRVRLAMRVSDERQIQYLVAGGGKWKNRVDSKALTWKGAGLLFNETDIGDQIKGYRMTPAAVDEHAVAVGDWRPPLDWASLRRGDSVTITIKGPRGVPQTVTVDGVWSNARQETYPIIFPTAAAVAGPPAGTQREHTSASPSPGAGGPDNVRDAMRGLADSAQGMFDALDRLEEKVARDRETGGMPEPDPEREIADLNAAWELDPVEPNRPRPAEDRTAGVTAPQQPPPPRIRVLQIVLEYADHGGTGPTAITDQLVREGYSTDRSTVSQWLRRFVAEDRVQQDGSRNPYFPGPKMGDPYQS